jgi:gliding motility-associated-like protein
MHCIKNICALIFTLIAINTSIFGQCTIQAYVDKTDIFCGQGVFPYAIADADTFVAVIDNDFNDGTAGNGWQTTPGAAIYNNPCGNDNDGTPHLWMGSATTQPRQLVSAPFDVTLGGKVCFDMKYAEQPLAVADADCEGPDEPQEGVYLQYSINGTTWVTMDYWDPNNGTDPNLINWKNYCRPIPLGALTTSTQFRWYQDAGSGAGNDHWGLDNIQILLNAPIYKYHWNHTSANLASPGEDFPAGPTFTYTVYYTDGKNDTCRSEVTVNVGMPTVVATTDKDYLCVGDEANLLATTTLGLRDEKPTSCGPSSGCTGSPGSGQIGTGNTVNNYNSGGNNVFGDFGPTNSNSRMQIMYKKGEFNAQGFDGGQITDMSFFISRIDDPGAYGNFKIYAACTQNANTSSFIALGDMTLIYSKANQTITNNNWNTFTFDTPYDWANNSNVVFQVCWNVGSQDRAAATRDHGTNFVSTIQAVVNGSSNAGACSATTFTNTESQRPNTRFSFCDGMVPVPESSLSFSWTPTDGLGTPTLSTTTASPDDSTTYTITVFDPNFPQCVATDTVNIGVGGGYAGLDTSLTICDTEDPFVLFNLIRDNPDLGGDFSDDANNPAPTNFDPTTQTAGNYSYFIDGAGCPDDTSFISIMVNHQPNPGLDSTVVICDTETINVFNSLGGNPETGGTWNIVTPPATLDASDVFDPNGLTPQDYLFEYSFGTAPQGCLDSMAIVTITVNHQPVAGIGYYDTVCNTLTAYDLALKLTGNPETGGTWNDEDGTGALNNNMFDPSLAFNNVGAGTYYFTYAILADEGCNDVSADVYITINEQPDAGEDNTLTICNTSNNINLFNNLGGNPDMGGSWIDVNSSGRLVNGNEFNPLNATAGDYQFRYEITAKTACNNSQALVTVTVEEQKSAGTDGSITLCDNAASFDLFNQLNSSPNTGGTWKQVATGNAVSNTFNPATQPSGDYSYTIAAGVACPATSAKVNVTVNQAPQAIAIIDTLCDGNFLNYQVRFKITGGDNSSYTVDGNPVTMNGNGDYEFVSSWIPSGATYSFNIDDANGCGPTVVNGISACDCASRPGTTGLAQLDICENQIATALHDTTNFYLDENDSLMYILHDAAGGNFGNILMVNTLNPSFAFDNQVLLYETTYYISAMVGNGLPDGTVDYLNDPCTRITPGTPVVFHELPDATISKDTLICDGGTADLELNFPAGNAPYSVIVNDGTSNVTYTGLNNGSIEQVSPTTSTTYTLVSVSDVYGCFQNIAGQQVAVNVNPNPTATFTGSNTTFCEGNGPAQFTVNVTGGAPNFDIVYFDDQAGSNQTITNVGLGNTTFNNAQALTPGTYNYQLVSITDRSNAACKTTFTDQVTVTVYENPEVTFTGDATICDGSNTPLNFSFPKGKANFAIDYSLNGSNVAPSLSGINNPDNISVTPGVGTNVYNIDQVTDANGCITTYPANAKQVTVIVNPNPTVGILPSNLTYCLGTDVTTFSFTFNGNGTPDFEIDYNINNGTKQTISNLDFTNNTWTFTPTTFGVYNIEFTEVRDAKCFTTLNNIFTITVFENPTADISPLNTFICQGQSAYVYFDYNGDSPWTAQYNIDNGSTKTITSTSNRDSLLIAPAASTTITLLDVVSDNTGCVQTGINKPVTVTVTETALVEIVGNNTICYGQSNDIQIVVNQGQGPFALTFNDTNLNGTYSNGDLITVAPDSTRTYSLTGVTDVAGCVWNPTGNDVTITVNPLPTLVFGPDTSICLGQAVDLTFEDFYGVGTPFEVIINNSSAFVNDGDVIQVSPTETTMYTITKVTDGSPQACVNNAPMEVTVEVTPLPSATIGGDYSECEGTSVDLTFDLTGYAPFALDYVSESSGVKNLTNIQNNHTETVTPVVGTHIYTINSVAMEAFPYCAAPQDSLHGTATVQVNPIPVPKFKITHNDSCIPTIPHFNNLTEKLYLGTSMWDLSGGISFEQNDSLFTKVLTIPRSYDVTLTIESPFGCIASKTQQDKIWVRPFPNADFKFYPDPVSVADREIKFLNETTGASIYNWTFYSDINKSDIVATYDVIDPIHPTPQEEGQYLMELHTESVHGCTDWTQKIVTVTGEMLINVPNSFTPNGDGINETFEPIIFGALATDFSFAIFDRWGELLYESSDLTNKAWDGIYKGKLVKDEQYIYRVIAKSKYTEKAEEITGTFRLIR